jgi:hypothetical protein
MSRTCPQPATTLHNHDPFLLPWAYWGVNWLLFLIFLPYTTRIWEADIMVRLQVFMKKPRSTPESFGAHLDLFCTVPGRQGRQKIIPQKNADKINKFIKYFVEINKNEISKNCRQKTKENVYPLVKFNVSY